MIRLNRGTFQFFGVITLLAFILLHVQNIEAAMKKIQAFKFADIYEPSTVVQLADGSVLIAEDEGDEPLFLSRVAGDGKDLKLEPVQIKEIDGALNDLEGSGLGKDGEVFLITSHSTNQKGKRKKKREVLTRLVFKDGKVSEKTFYGDLHQSIQKTLKKVHGIDDATSRQLNIEGLTFNSSKSSLLLGLRSPLAGDKAIILVLENPYALFSKGQSPKFKQDKISLDIGGGGIRSITYDSRRKVYLVANEIPNKKGKLRPALWAWDGKVHSSPVQVSLPKMKGMKNLEGMNFVKFQKKTFLLMVFDDGDRKKNKGAHYSFLDASMLEY